MPKNTVHVTKSIQSVKTQVEAAITALNPKKKGAAADVEAAKEALTLALQAVEKLAEDYKTRREGYTTRITKLREKLDKLNELSDPAKSPIPTPPPLIALHKEVVKSSEALGKIETKLEQSTGKKGATDPLPTSELLEQIRNFRGTLKKVEDSVAVDPKGTKKYDDSALGLIAKALDLRRQAIDPEEEVEDLTDWNNES